MIELNEITFAGKNGWKVCTPPRLLMNRIVYFCSTKIVDRSIEEEYFTRGFNTVFVTKQRTCSAHDFTNIVTGVDYRVAEMEYLQVDILCELMTGVSFFMRSSILF